MKTKLEQLYARRRLLDQERAQLTRLIAALENQGTSIAIAKVHHATQGCSMVWLQRPTQTPWGQRSKCAKKVSKDWSVVDCLRCLRLHDRQHRKASAVPWKRP